MSTDLKKLAKSLHERKHPPEGAETASEITTLNGADFTTLSGTPAAGATGAGESRLPVRLDFAEGSDDSLAGWVEAYFAVEVTTAPELPDGAAARPDALSPLHAGGGGERRAHPLDEPPVAGVRGRPPQRAEVRRRPLLLRPHHRPHGRALKDLREVDPPPAALPHGRPHRKAEDDRRRPGPRDRAGAHREPEAQAPRCRRPSSGLGRSLPRPPPHEGRRVRRRAPPPQGLPPLAQPGDRLRADRHRHAPRRRLQPRPRRDRL